MNTRIDDFEHLAKDLRLGQKVLRSCHFTYRYSCAIQVWQPVLLPEAIREQQSWHRLRRDVARNYDLFMARCHDCLEQ